MQRPGTHVQIDMEFRTWLRNAANLRGWTVMDIRDRFPMEQPHPRTVAGWLGYDATPRYAHLVGLAWVLEELPPALRDLCPSVS